jgi:hypothetical protein
MSFPGMYLIAPVPPNCMIVSFKLRILMPAEQAIPSEGNLIRENTLKT